jgi:hypothetical protein
MLGAGCAGERNQSGVQGETNTPALTAEDAQQALLEMDFHAQPPKDEPIKFIDEDVINIGSWTCNLKERTFHASFHFPGRLRHETTKVWGVFQQTSTGKWSGKVIGIRHE